MNGSWGIIDEWPHQHEQLLNAKSFYTHNNEPLKSKCGYLELMPDSSMVLMRLIRKAAYTLSKTSLGQKYRCH